MSQDVPELNASSDVREPISLHQAVDVNLPSSSSQYRQILHAWWTGTIIAQKRLAVMDGHDSGAATQWSKSVDYFLPIALHSQGMRSSSIQHILCQQYTPSWGSTTSFGGNALETGKKEQPNMRLLWCYRSWLYIDTYNSQTSWRQTRTRRATLKKDFKDSCIGPGGPRTIR